MSKRRLLLPMLETLKEQLIYDPDTGNFFWIYERMHVPSFSQADRIDSRKEYKTICWKGVKYTAHRIAWLLMMEEEPPEELDHEDTNGLNNVWTNIREATSSKNNMNRSGYARSGFKGAYHLKNGFVAQIRKDGVVYRLGYFKTAEEAHKAYCKASEELHGEYGRTNYKNNL